MAMVKHFIAYDGGNNVVVDSATLHEIYLQPFADAIDAGVASIMCSYNTLQVVQATPAAGGTPGPYSCGNPGTLTGILRGELGFKGFATSDWGANHATGFISDGLDMEMPGSVFGGVLPAYFSASALQAAITAGTVSMSTIDAAVGHILFEMDRFGLLHGGSKHQVTPEPLNADWTGDLNAPLAGSYWINLGLLGAGRSIRLDGKQIAATGFINGTAPRYGVLRPGDNSVLPTTDGLDNLRTQLSLSAGQHTLTVAIAADASGDPVQARLNWVTPAQRQANTDAAVAAAKQARTAVVFAWSTGSLDTPLPDGQDQLIADAAAANPNTIVVLNNSDPVAMPWLGSVRAVLDMWYPGDTGGYATANVLLGHVDPAGRLPFTWPASLGQGVANQPATHPERTSNGVDASGKFCITPGSPFGGPQCTTTYTEGIFVGYRWYDQQHETPLYPFGYGLSYTRFAYSGLHAAPARDGGLDVAFRVTNTGSATGDEVPQVYLGAPAEGPAGVAFASRALAAYSRITLRPGQSQLVWLHVPLRQLQYWDTQSGGWVTAAGQRPLYVASNERSTGLTATVTIPGGGH